MRDLILVRGLPGSGKTTFAEILGGEHFETDQYFIDKITGEYNFDPVQLADNYRKCKEACELAMVKERERIIVSNTFVQEWELQPYIQLAERFGYRVFSVIVEYRHDGESVHDVPDEVIEKMYSRFSIQL